MVALPCTGNARDMAGKGGKRSTSFQPKWKLGETVAIRIPSVVREYLLKIARCLDNGEDYERQVILTALRHYVDAQQSSPGGNQHRKKGEPPNIGESRDWTHFVRFKKEIEKEL